MTEQPLKITESNQGSYFWLAIWAILVPIVASLLLIATPLATHAEGLPDLVPTAFNGPSTIGTGQAIPLSWTVENQGTGDAGTVWYDFVYLSADNLLDDQDPRVGTFPQYRTLAAGTSYDASGSVQAPFAQGSYYLILQTNAWSHVSEADHTNNVMVIGPITVADDPVILVEILIDDVMDLNLQQGIENSLDAKLEAASNALADLNENNDVAAINSLQAFINAVEAQRGQDLTDELADELVERAQAIIDSLSAS
jgi:hypothetical protein